MCNDNGCCLNIVIGPKVVDTTFSLFYSNVVVGNSWVDVSEKSYPILWNPLTNDDIDEINVKYKTVSDDEIDGNMYAKQNKQRVTNARPTVMHNLDCPNIDPCQIVNMAPAEGQIPESHKNEPDFEALSFPKEFLTGQFHLNFKRKKLITVLKYIHF